MVSSDKHFANVVGGKTARACDNCIRKRARWYCSADDAFLCQSCDGSVHAANPLARRHERLRLKVALSCLDKHAQPPPWQRGFTRKPRTPRGGKHACRQTTKSEESSMSMSFNPLHLVPEMGGDETTTMTTVTTSCEQEQVLYQVPVFDRFAVDNTDHHHHRGKSKMTLDLNSLNGLIPPSDVELAEFAADVESLLGKGLDDMEGLGFLECRSEKDGGKVKVEEDDQMQYEIVEMMREPFKFSFDYDSPAFWEENDDGKVAVEGGGYGGGDEYKAVVKVDGENKKKERILKLDFEGIIAAWDEQRSPWTTGDRPEVDPDDCWPECMGGCGLNHHYLPNSYGDKGMMTGNPTMLDRGREARVSRYREKRRTRLFSKKIRYEVRKLNAEKRPRMKGRFVKRTSSSFV